MKKIFFAVALLLGMSALFVSCNKDNGSSEGDYAKLIVGTWMAIKEEYYKNGKLSGSQTEDDALTFTADGKVYSSYSPSQKRNYTISGNKLVFQESDIQITIIKLTTTELVLDVLEDDGLRTRAYYEKE